jgi:putative transposase
MARPLRIQYPGAIYHITSRGIDRRAIFLDEKDFKKLIQILREGADFFRVEVITYCLMSNHFHFLLRTRQANLSRFMQWISVSYTRYFNYKHKRVGPLMQGRYKAILVGSDDYFSELSRYIYLNPVRLKSLSTQSLNEKARIVNDYMWSSYKSVIEPGKRSRYFCAEEVLKGFGGDTVLGRRKYEDYVLSGIEKSLENNPMKEVKFQLVLGTEKFFGWVRDNFIKSKNLKAHTHLRGVFTSRPPLEIAEAVAKRYNVRTEDILTKKSKYVEARNILLELTYQSNINNKTLTEIGKKLGGISGSAVGYAHKRIKERLNEDKDFTMVFEEIARSLSILET